MSLKIYNCIILFAYNFFSISRSFAKTDNQKLLNLAGDESS